MKFTRFIIYLSLAVFSLPACRTKVKPAREADRLAVLFDSAEVTGSLLFHRVGSDEVFGYNVERFDEKFIPASTFKIPNTVVALESGVADTGRVFKWDGKPRSFHSWERDLTLREAMEVSCVPVYQTIAREIGARRMREYLAKMDYPGMRVREDNIDLFWLDGRSAISSREQARFLTGLWTDDLEGVSQRTTKTVKGMLPVHQIGPGRTIMAKTGTALRADSPVGWWVGYYITPGNTYVFVINLEMRPGSDYDRFITLRKTIVTEAIELLKLK